VIGSLSTPWIGLPTHFSRLRVATRLFLRTNPELRRRHHLAHDRDHGALTPFTIKSTKSMAAMSRLQPEIKKLQVKYKGPENRATSTKIDALYKEENANPIGAVSRSYSSAVPLHALQRHQGPRQQGVGARKIGLATALHPVHSKMYTSSCTRAVRSKPLVWT